MQPERHQSEDPAAPIRSYAWVAEILRRDGIADLSPDGVRYVEGVALEKLAVGLRDYATWRVGQYEFQEPTEGDE